jgi:hypothetical protein
MTQIQAQFSFASISSDREITPMPPIDVNAEVVDLLEGLADFFKTLSPTMTGPNRAPNHRCGTVSPPIREDRCHPCGSLRVDQDSGVITTPGGYKIEQVGQYEWKITGPDGKWTRIWGDPHVQESDRSCESTAWDFKRDSTFVLPDGTQINVTTKPYNNMTVTSQLEIINGNERVMVTDIDKGKGKVGQVTRDVRQHVADRCGRDVFVMGKETDDWYFHGKEVIGSNEGGDSFKLGQANNDDMQQLLDQVQSFAWRLLSSLYRNWPTGRGVEGDRMRERLGEQIAAINQLFHTIAQLRDMDDRLASGRFSFQC